MYSTRISVRHKWWFKIAEQWSRIDPAWTWSLGIFLFYRLLFTLWSALITTLYPYTEPEMRVSVIPDISRFADWFGRVFLWPTMRYDAFAYVGIAEVGYSNIPGSTAFHPLYPLLSHIMGSILGGHFVAGALIVSHISGFLALVLLYQLIRLDHSDYIARTATLFLVGSPLGFIFFVPYSEALFLLCIVACFYAVRHQRWWLAGIAGCGAVLTRQPGLILVFPLLWECWKQYGGEIRQRDWRTLVRPVLAIGLIPLGMACVLLYRASLGDIRLEGWSLSAPWTGVLVTPTYDTYWKVGFVWPWEGIAHIYNHLTTQLQFFVLFNTIVILVMLISFLASVWHQRFSYSIFGAILFWLALSFVHPTLPTLATVRRCMVIFPIFIQLACWAQNRLVWITIVFFQTLSWVYTTSAFLRNAYVP